MGGESALWYVCDKHDFHSWICDSSIKIRSRAVGVLICPYRTIVHAVSSGSNVGRSNDVKWRSSRSLSAS